MVDHRSHVDDPYKPLFTPQQASTSIPRSEKLRCLESPSFVQLNIAHLEEIVQLALLIFEVRIMAEFFDILGWRANAHSSGHNLNKNPDLLTVRLQTSEVNFLWLVDNNSLVSKRCRESVVAR